MNRVLNKDFVMKSYLNSALIAFSDVFRPASLMQSCKMCDQDGHGISSCPDHKRLKHKLMPPIQGESDEELVTHAE